MKQERDIVLGLGATGYSVVRHLHTQCPLSVFDSRLGRDAHAIPFLNNVRMDYPDVDVISPRGYKRALESARRVIASPGIPLSNSMLKWAQIERIPVVGDIDLFMEQVRAPVIGITGTNGKSTTVSLVVDMLQDRGFVACGNIGTPVLDTLKSKATGYVLELSSFQLERLQKGPFKVASILNISEDHLDHHGSMEHYRTAKQRIYQDAEFAVYDHLRPETIPDKILPGVELNRDPDWTVREEGITVGGELLQLSEIALSGSHYLQNLLTAAAISIQLGASIEDVARVARTFEGLPHRAQTIGTFNGVEFINDSKATNVCAAIASIQEQYEEGSKLILICGGDGKAADFKELGVCIDKLVSHTILFGNDAQSIASCIHRTGYEFVTSMDDAVSVSVNLSQSGDKVLLAPACASFDMFNDFAHRGTTFTKCVSELLG
ncbi:MAG: UDP-N-acetylmuramoyl-L-alanine--D-glutamate ligase [Gammaproteobacteria bacterium]|nr:UDP-N-acetylmuramoyl-L-alanine--D-glutamate ligase [Gammaproteobacteria bacterium]MYF02358.1 UDP-N-acetylmuramoyl-L-alanine--D-glutamate ligase [Gammaproteobacteria bacterium]MYI76935.1 UDP-N-acetylmuramoyl-L-alanine--D-glutamate ligase [Gammaproteobacteria bacterium]